MENDTIIIIIIYTFLFLFFVTSLGSEKKLRPVRRTHIFILYKNVQTRIVLCLDLKKILHIYIS